MIRAAVFDLDHTLFDRYKTFQKITEIVPKEMSPFETGVPPKELAAAWEAAERELYYLGHDAIAYRLKCEGYIKKDVSTTDIYRNYFRKMFKLAAVPFDFADAALNKIRAMGVKTALITNGPADIQQIKLDFLNYTHRFDAQIFCDDITVARKPSAEPFLKMAKMLQIQPFEALYIGDNPYNDIIPSAKAGYTPVWVKTIGVWPKDCGKKPEYSVNTVAEIPKLIKTINGGKL